MRPNLFTTNMKKFQFLIMLLLFALQCWSQVTVSGTIRDENGLPVCGVTVGVNLSGTDVVTTDSTGFYELTVANGSDFSIAPYKNSSPLNGVGTFDMVLISNHVLGVSPLGSPYKIIAADINKSNTVSSFDLVEFRDMLTFVTPNFPNNTSWRFVDASYVFSNPLNPFVPGFPETISINNATGNITGQDFVAIKVGDVNNNAINQLCSDTGSVSLISGKIFHDLDGTCTETASDYALKYWKVRAIGANETYYSIADADGQYSIYLPQGTYDVQVLPASPLWVACTPTYTSVVVGPVPVGGLDFAEQALLECPAMEVEMSTGLLRRCFQNTYSVLYCNHGTAMANDAQVVVTLDSFFINVSSSAPFTTAPGNVYTFDVGDVAPNDCGWIPIDFELSCDAELGQTHCSSAHIYPDTSCVPPLPLWSGADLQVTGECLGDSIVFTVTNIGDDMPEPVPYVIIEDIMIQMSGETLQLQQGESITVTVPANGSTWRFVANELAFNPYDNFASATVEGCGTNSSGGVSFGFVNLFPLPDGSPFEDMDCKESIGSFDPNDKVGLPLGVDAEHFIEQNQDLSYTIRFQNTGTDTAFNVVVLDQLPASLDPGTFRFLGSSHPCEYQLNGNGYARFTFENIMLPDSNVNEVASHGFVKFAIAQKTDLPLGTQIENEAGIYFDFNDPVITNRTLHTVGKDFLMEVSATQTLVKGLEMEVYPNPTTAIANFRFKGLELKEGRLMVFDQFGKQVSTMSFTGTTCQFDGSGMASGLYFFKVVNADKPIAAGKLIVK
ncbi:MAG: T9SS type A sorting domain-containing protein [Bacteroidetes bacterium]|nr:T9SS type A sorting domain-containing protein [Bacteroidota bacterium]